MSGRIRAGIAILALLVLFGCAAESRVYRGDTADAEWFFDLPGAPSSGDYYDVTSPAVAAAGLRVWKNEESGAAYLASDDGAYPLLEFFGGYGVTDMALFDGNGDGECELFFTYSWGSGIHRACIGYFDTAAGEAIALADSSFYLDSPYTELALENRDGELCVRRARIELEDCAHWKLILGQGIAGITEQDGAARLIMEEPEKPSAE